MAFSMLSNPTTLLSNNTLLLPEKLQETISSNKSFSLKKHDVSTTVGIIKGSDFNLSHDLLVKRFNYRGFFDFLLHMLFNNKAKKLWDINLRLYKKGLPVPEPFSYTKLSFTQKQSFYLSHVIENAEKLSTVYRKGLFYTHKELVQHLARTIAEWHLNNVVHGDLKWPNILLQQNGPEYKFFLIDLDQTRIFQKPSMIGIIKDLTRFYRFGIEMSAEDWVKNEFFPLYMAFIRDGIGANIDVSTIRQEAFKDWKKKGHKKY
jgi:tRNA A-37 threonylcarbamoyl transferase component Bud32